MADFIYISPELREKHERRLRTNLRAKASVLGDLYKSGGPHWGYVDGVYRFYHQSYKVYAMQADTLEIVKALKSLLPRQPLNPWFLQIVEEGTGKDFRTGSNEHWLAETRPMVEAFFHARFFLEMACRYSKAPEFGSSIPSGWAALLYLFNLR